ncbi:MAG: 4-hydroxy-tetrahydrodipicolinate synthase [Elusimicrobia bacterium]|nr:4-hydroxy-tetrahydrodipicolinate synthase [Elusimicrobiota bacterium]
MFEGSAVALVTPFKNNAVDEQKLKELVEFQIAGGTRTIVPCGTTGETSTLSHEEHNRVVELTVKFVNKRARVLAGTGSNATQEAIELTRHAKAVGADGTLQITPYYNKPTQRGLADHFKAIAEAVDLPIVLYNVPGRTGVNMLPSTVVDLVRSCPRVVGIKEASGNIDQSTEIIQALGPVFEVLSGDDSLTLPILAVGGKGVVSVVANLVPGDVSGLCAAWEKGDTADAARRHLKLYPLCRAMFLETNPIPVKTAMGWLDLCEPDMRLPLTPLEKGQRGKTGKSAARLRAGGPATPARGVLTC